jgi:hypothetical protein
MMLASNMKHKVTLFEDDDSSDEIVGAARGAIGGLRA